MARHRRSRGVVTRMRKAARKEKRPRSLWDHVKKWGGGGILLALIVGAIALIAFQAGNPKLGAQTLEEPFEVLEIREDAGVRRAVVSIEAQTIEIRVPDEVVAGSWLDVRYEAIPRTRSVRVLGATIGEAPPEDDAEDMSDAAESDPAEEDESGT